MTIESLTAFFMWCTIINGVILTIWVLAYMLMPNAVYRTQARFFPMPQETFKLLFYSFIGLFKILFLVFNAAPYIALLIIG